MPGNKFLIADRSSLLKNKLEKISANLSKSINSTNFQTEEQLITESIKILETFYRDLQEPVFKPTEVAPDDYPDSATYNDIWNQLLDDLLVIFLELENVEALTLANFNFVSTEANRLLTRLKNVSSKLGDFILFSSNPTKDAFFSNDSFNDLSKIDIGSPLLNAEECEVNQDEGIVTLPVNKDADSIIQVRELPVINPDSNGVKGNNQELGVSFNGNIALILDDNPDTWFEYERITTAIEDTKEPLVLDLTINIGDPTVVNFVRLNPNNFGTKTSIEVAEIETSIDGIVFTSIKDDIPIADFVIEDEENVFTLAPATSKFAGQGIYTFTPRKIKYLHIVLKQEEPFTIQTAQGQRLRYAIGLRDVEIKGLVYNETGEIISNPFKLVDEIRKVLLDANQNPSEESELATIQYFISPDDGITWHEIQPKQFTGLPGRESLVPEIINFNGPEEDSIATTIPAKSLRLKAILTRDNAAFEEGSSTFKKTVELTSEIHEVPGDAPFEFTLNEAPVEGTVEIVDPLFGSRGIKTAPYILGHGIESSLDQQTFVLPFENLPRPFEKVLTSGVYNLEPVRSKDYLHITVGGEEWAQTPSPLSTFDADFSSDLEFRLYTFNPANKELAFGFGHDTMSPPTNSPIGMFFDAEQLFPSEVPGKHVAKLEFKTGVSKRDVKITRKELEKESTEIIARKATILRLENRNITDKTGVVSALTTLGYTIERSFLNGKDEFTDLAQWSIDLEEGTIYTSDPTPADRQVSLVYKYQPLEVLNEDQWDWVTGDSLRDSVLIKEESWKTFEEKDLVLPVSLGIRVLDLKHLAVVKDTVELNLVDTTGAEIDEDTNPFVQEVEFIDGVQELGNEITRTIETVPALVPGINNIASFNLIENISSNSIDHIVTFSKPTIFITEDAALDDVGDWTIDRTVSSSTYGQVQVKLAVSIPVSNQGTITYFYTNPNFASNGLYSIDYRNGRIFLQRQLQGGSFSLKATYQFTDYEIEYKIARILDVSRFEVDVVTNTVRIKDEEILQKSLLPKDKLSGLGQYYQVNYDFVATTREDILELRDFFTPVIKDYSLKIITKRNLL